ncbi:ABC transporter ATP-binding protein [Streptomyces sp. NPDC006186]|uniref:ABC transporter ATP-binding protein n=1 Tax=Streptomyces sp. NPDC006186 TaxID=3155248 RepID=UPI0033A8FE7F
MLSAEGVELFYGETQAIRHAEMLLRRGEITAITGQSGSGKSSLLYCLAGVVPVADGEVRFQGRVLGRMDDQDLCALRREHFGFVFQYGELLPELTVDENAALPLRLLGHRKGPALAEAREVLGRLGLGKFGRRRPSQLSGGQCQRVAVARALVHKPTVVFADEPTGSLDSGNASAVLHEFLTLARSMGTAVVLVTHDRHVASRADSLYEMCDGVLVPRAREAV